MSAPLCKSLIRLTIAATLLGFLGVYGVQQAAAQQSQNQAVNTFLTNPTKLLEDNPEGGARLVSLIRDLAVADAGTLQPILNLLATANKDQKTAIGSGLGQAARIVVRTNQAYALAIQQAIARTRDQDAVLAFTSVVGDQPIATAGAGVAGGAVGGQVQPLPGNTGNTGPALPIGGGSVPTGPFTYSSFVSGLGGAVTQENSP